MGIDRAAIEKLIQSLIDTPIDSIHAAEDHGVLIARHGKLVLEEYFHGEHRDKLHETRSAAKSLTATLLGAAIEAGAPLDTSTPVLPGHERRDVASRPRSAQSPPATACRSRSSSSRSTAILAPGIPWQVSGNRIRYGRSPLLAPQGTFPFNGRPFLLDGRPFLFNGKALPFNEKTFLLDKKALP